VDILRSDKTRAAFDTTKERAKVRESYGPTPFGQSVLTARRLIEAGARFVTVGLGNWDTHFNNFITLGGQLLPQLDAALAALLGVEPSQELRTPAGRPVTAFREGKVLEGLVGG